MVDLHESLRPTGTTSPRPISEIAAHAKRRKRRRTIATSGTVAATLAIGGFAVAAVLRTPAEVTTIADGAATEQSAVTSLLPDPADPATSDPSLQNEAVTEDPGLSEGSGPANSSGDEVGTPTTGTAVAGEDLMTTPGIRISTTTTSEWDSGYCVQIEVANDTDDRQTWQVVIERDGAVASIWNASVSEVNGSFVFAGEEGYNTMLEPRAGTSFGTCIDT